MDKQMEAMGAQRAQQPAGPPPYTGQPPAHPPQGYPPQGYPPQPGAYPGQPYYGAVPPQPQPANVGVSEQQMRTNERRQREQRQNDCIMGMLCGGCLICLCVGQDKATECGVSVMDRLLCMDVPCWGF